MMEVGGVLVLGGGCNEVRRIEEENVELTIIWSLRNLISNIAGNTATVGASWRRANGRTSCSTSKLQGRCRRGS